MKIAVFGSTGKTGIQVVQQALEQGIEVKAFVRDPRKMKIGNEKLSLIQGDVVDAKTVDECVEGVDAVIVALGPKSDGTGNVMAEGTDNIIGAMKKHGIRRVIVESSFPMSGSPEGMAFLKKLGMTEEQMAMAKPATDDKIRQEGKVRESGLQWVIVRPLMLTEGAKTSHYRVGEKLDVKPEDHISRSDVADFMLRSLNDDEWLYKTVTITY